MSRETGIGIGAVAVLAVLGVAHLAKMPCGGNNQALLSIVPPAATLLVVVTVAWSLVSLRRKRLTHVTRAILLGFWLVVPPLWFSYEYFHLYRPNLQRDETKMLVQACNLEWEQFKYGQESAAKIWGAVVLFLGALYFRDGVA